MIRAILEAPTIGSLSSKASSVYSINGSDMVSATAGEKCPSA
jgi:hypothetical protein